MSARELASWIGLLGPHVVAVALCAARLVPVAFLCPLLGGQAAPTTVKLGVVLSLALSLHLAGGVMAPPGGALAGPVARELVFGMAIGLIAALPFDAARMGGRFIDLFRGVTTEAMNPLAGSREAVTGEALYHLLVALAVTGAAGSTVLSAVWRSFGVVPLGGFVATEPVALRIAGGVGGAMAIGLAVGAPVAAASLMVDLWLGLAARAAPGLSLREVGAPLRVLSGSALLWMGLGLVSERLVTEVLASGGAMRALFEVAR